jgi:hypothetical protein
MPRPLVHLPLPPGARHAAHRVDPRCAGPHDAPSGQEEAEALELGGRVAIFRCYQSLLFDAPADYA